MIRVLVADDHTILRAGLKALLARHQDFEVVGEAGDGREAVAFFETSAADVVLMDIAMAGLNGIEATRRIVANKPDAKVAILSMHSDESYVLRALKAGARAYLLKESAEEDIVDAVRSVAAGKSFFSPKVSRLLRDDYVRELESRGMEDSLELLTAREREVLQLVAEGLSNKEVAQRLDLSLYTVETHRRNILEKLDLHSTAEVILFAVRKGLVH